MNTDDIALGGKDSKPFSSVFRTGRERNEKIYCSLCANAGIESIIRDDVCGFCGDVGIKIGVTKDDDLFVVNSVGGSEDSDSGESNIVSASFGGLPTEKKSRPNQHRSLQDALKETEI